MECIHYFFTNGTLTGPRLQVIVPLVHAQDAEVRLMIADDLGLWGDASAESLLTNVLATDTMPGVRRFALRSLLELKSTRVLPLVRRLVLDDPSEDVRRIAVRYLSRVRDNMDPRGLIEKVVKTDARPAVRTAAADGLGYLKDPLALKALRTAGKSSDVYLQRAVGKALADLYQVEGIQMLIKTMSFPSIDAFYNYDRNVPNYIMAYTNHDLPDSVRYDQNQWQKWFNRNKKKIDLKTNAEAFQKFTALTDMLKDSTTEAQLREYNALLHQYPGQKIIINRIAALKDQ
ncbi:MAG TPA: HEAT repeat domain-containing protein [bacterium]